MLKARRSDRPPAPKKIINKKSNTIKNFYNSKFGFVKRYMVYIFFSLMITSVGFTFLVPMLVNLKVWKPEIKSMLEAETGKIAYIEGDIELSIYPSPQIKIYGVSLKDEKDGILSNFFNSNSVVAKLSLWPLLKGNIVIDKIIFEELTINLENYPNKDPNWVFYKKENKLELDINEFNQAHKKFNQVKYPNIKINEYAVTKGNIIYNNNSKINLKDILITKNNNADLIKGDINLNGINFSLNSSFVKNNDDKKVWKSSLSLINKDMKVLIKGNVNINNNFPGLEGSLEISSDELSKLSKSYKYLNLLNNRFKLISKLSLSFQNNNLLYSAYNLSINSGAHKFTGTVSGNNGIKPKIDLILSSNNIDLDLLGKSLSNLTESLSNAKDQNLKTKNSYWNLYEGTMLLSIGTSKFLEYPIRDVLLDIKKEDKNYILNIGKGTFPGNTKISFKGNLKNDFSVFEGSSVINSDNIRQFSKWLSIDIKNISDSRLRKTKLYSNVVIRDGGASFVGIDGKIDSSKVTGEVRLRYKDFNSLYANLKVDKINLDAYLEESKHSEGFTKINNLDIFTFDQVNIDIDFDKFLINKNEYNDIKLLGKYKDNVIKIDELSMLNFAKGSMKLTGSIDYSSKATIYDLAININHKDFEQFYSFYNLPKYFQDLLTGKGKIEMVAKGELDSLLSKIKLDTGLLNIIYEGGLNIKKFSLDGYDGKINLKINNLNKFLSLNSKKDLIQEASFFSNILMKNNKLNIENIDFKSADYKYNGDIHIDYLKNNNIIFDINLFANSTSINNIKSIYNYFVLSPNFPTKGRIKLKADLFHFNKLKIYNFNTSANLNEEEFHLKFFEGDLFDGTISAEGKRSNKKEYEYDGNIKFSNINGKELINNYFSYSKIEGNISSKVKVKGKAANLEQLFKTVNAEGEIFIKKSIINGLDISKLIETKNIKDIKNIDKFVIESFNTDKQAQINNFSIKYNINNNNILFDEVNIEIDELNSLFKGKFNFDNLDYNAFLKINIDDNDNKNISLKFINNRGLKNLIIENDYVVKKQVNENHNINNKIEDNTVVDFDDIIDGLSSKPFVSKVNNKILLQDEINNEIIKENVEIIESNESFSRLPEYLKYVKDPIYKDYFKPKLIKNIISKPKLPTQEDLLNNLLENVLNP